MRRMIAVAALAGALLVGAGCSGDGAGANAPTTTPPQPVPTSSPPDPKAQEICDDLRRNVLDADAKAFGAELGKMITARTHNNKNEETRAQQAAIAKLNEIAGKLRKHSGEATDPQLKDALNASATNLEKLASDTGNFEKLNSLDGVGQTTQKFATALAEIADACAA